MSGVVKFVKKVFKKVVKVVKKIWKAIKKIIVPLLILAAVYFTAGVALGATGAFGGASTVSGWVGFGAGGPFSTLAANLGAWTGFAEGGIAIVGAEAAAGAAAGEALGTAAAGEATTAGAGSFSAPIEAGANLVAPAGSVGEVGSATSQLLSSEVAAGEAARTAGTAAAENIAAGKTAADFAAGAGGVEKAGFVSKALDMAGKAALPMMMAGNAMSGAAQARAEAETIKDEREYQYNLPLFGADSQGRGTLPTEASTPFQPRSIPSGQVDPATGRYTVLRPSDLVERERQGYIGNARVTRSV